MKLRLTKLEFSNKDGKTVTLTLDEARQLHEQLSEVFATCPRDRPVIIQSWPPVWWNPPWTYTDMDVSDRRFTTHSISGNSITFCGEEAIEAA